MTHNVYHNCPLKRRCRPPLSFLWFLPIIGAAIFVIELTRILYEIIKDSPLLP